MTEIHRCRGSKHCCCCRWWRQESAGVLVGLVHSCNEQGLAGAVAVPCGSGIGHWSSACIRRRWGVPRPWTLERSRIGLSHHGRIKRGTSQAPAPPASPASRRRRRRGLRPVGLAVCATPVAGSCNIAGAIVSACSRRMPARRGTVGGALSSPVGSPAERAAPRRASGVHRCVTHGARLVSYRLQHMATGNACC